jgi:hypothetical protein
MVRSATIEPIKEFIIRQSKLQWLVIGVFTHFKLTLYGRLALDNAVLERIEIPGHTLGDVIKLRSETPSYDLIIKEQEKQRELWNVFFIATWAEFECAIEDIRLHAIKASPNLADELLGKSHANMQKQTIGRKLRERVQPTSSSRFLQDLYAYELIGFSRCDSALADTLLEANTLRNVLLHNRGAVDEIAIKECPSINQIISPVQLSMKNYERYSNATIAWSQHLLADLVRLDKLTSKAPQ